MALLETVDEGAVVISDEAVTAAATLAADGADKAAVQVRALDGIAEMRLAGALFSRVWEFTDESDRKVPLDLLQALSHAGGYVAGAWCGNDLVGASLGFARLGGPNASLHSHITGVVPGSAGAGVGRALKLHQRHWALERGISEIMWTFDPLVRRNGYFNVSKLGARIVSYYEDFYGPMADGLNHRGESDRCLAKWDLLDERVVAALGGTPPKPAAEHEGVVVLLDSQQTLTAFDRNAVSPRVLVWVPEDIVAIRRVDPVGAIRWRKAVRYTLGAAIREGWTVDLVRSDGWYELEPPTGEGI